MFENDLVNPTELEIIINLAGVRDFVFSRFIACDYNPAGDLQKANAGKTCVSPALGL
jgi:hypothetical protein